MSDSKAWCSEPGHDGCGITEPYQHAESVTSLRILEVLEESDAATVNRFLSNGNWVLLSVGQDPYGVAHYVLGMPQFDGPEDGA